MAAIRIRLSMAMCCLDLVRHRFRDAGGLSKLTFQRHMRVSKPALEFRGLVLQVSQALAPEVNIVFEVRSHFTSSVRSVRGQRLTRAPHSGHLSAIPAVGTASGGHPAAR